MKDEQFKHEDDKMMERMKPVREKRVAPEFLKGFAASVIRKIEKPSHELPPNPTGWRVVLRQVTQIAPVFAVLVLAVVTVTNPGWMTRPDAPAPEAAVFEIAQLPHPVERVETALDEEIQALREIGEWTEADEEAAGVVDEGETLEEVLG